MLFQFLDDFFFELSVCWSTELFTKKPLCVDFYNSTFCPLLRLSLCYLAIEGFTSLSELCPESLVGSRPYCLTAFYSSQMSVDGHTGVLQPRKDTHRSPIYPSFSSLSFSCLTVHLTATNLSLLLANTPSPRQVILFSG